MPMPDFPNLSNADFSLYFIAGIIVGSVLVFLKMRLYKTREKKLATMQITPYQFEVWQAKQLSTFLILFICFLGCMNMPLLLYAIPALLSGNSEFSIYVISVLIMLGIFMDALLPYINYHFTFANDMVAYTNKLGITFVFSARDIAFVNIEMYMAQRRLRIYLHSEKQIVMHSMTLPVNAQDLFLQWCEGYRIPVQRS